MHRFASLNQTTTDWYSVGQKSPRAARGPLCERGHLGSLLCQRRDREDFHRLDTSCTKVVCSNFAILCILVVLLVAGCLSAPSHFYTLSSATESATATSDLSVVVGPVTVPAEVDRPEMVVSTGPNQVRVDEFNRWASPLQDNLSRVIVTNLVILLGTPNVVLSQQMLNPGADYRVAVEVQHFDSTLGQSVLLDAVWTVRRTSNGTSKTGRTAVREAVQENSYEALAAAHSQAAERLCQKIADAVQVLERSAP